MLQEFCITERQYFAGERSPRGEAIDDFFRLATRDAASETSIELALRELFGTSLDSASHSVQLAQSMAEKLHYDEEGVYAAAEDDVKDSRAQLVIRTMSVLIAGNNTTLDEPERLHLLKRTLEFLETIGEGYSVDFADALSAHVRRDGERQAAKLLDRDILQRRGRYVADILFREGILTHGQFVELKRKLR